ncbi:hypothetical protein [Senegalia sp. (in: firmicutes)]|uniref:hypothetical protein n=1 Tax=Senegalia sp. (in: firmicutes) TaxID=1924098 RepID=UPI003F98CCB4
MKDKVYTLLDLAEEFGKDKQFIRRRIMRLKLSAVNKESREHINEPLKYDYHTYLELAKELGMSDMENNDMHETHDDTQNDTHETHDDTQKKAYNINEDRIIEVLERELKHSKDKLKKSEEEKETLMKLLDQQQRLSLQANQKIEMLEQKKEDIKKDEIQENQKKKWWQFFR